MGEIIIWIGIFMFVMTLWNIYSQLRQTEKDEEDWLD